MSLQRVRINESFSEWAELLFGVPQESILGPLLFIIILCDIFYFEEYIDIVSYADDSTPCSADFNIDNTISSLENSSAQLFNWFQQNSM